MIDWQRVPIPSPDFCVRKIDDETMFLTESGDEIITLNEVGSFIWEQIDGQHSLADVLDILCDEFEVSRDEAAADLEAFVVQLQDHGLVALETPS
jgi:hypothetical protein